MNSERTFESTGAAPLAAGQPLGPAAAWEPFVLRFRTRKAHDWWEFPVRVLFQHAESGEALELEGCDNGDGNYLVRVSLGRPGRWRYVTRSQNPELDGLSGELDARPASADELEVNPNLRGPVRIAADGRRFEYADGSPVFLLGDTLWAVNTARCGLGERRDGPFYQYMADRKRKGFNTVLMAYMRGFGDTTTEPAGQCNEGGYPFVEGDSDRLNAAYFEMLDRRMHALWANGFIVAAHPTWFGKLNCFFTSEQAKRISAYLAVRYGAYNAIWSLSGEYQYAMRDCGWKEEDIDELGRTVQRRNPYRRPLSIHPSSRTDWPAPHNQQSSRAFDASAWLDHHWLQTGQRREALFRVPARVLENRRTAPPKPVFLAEGYYERAADPDHAYHSRWQVWTAFLCGAAGYGYGAFGVWQFHDPDDGNGECGKSPDGTIPWKDALRLEGSRQMGVFQKLIAPLPWWELAPSPGSLTVDGRSAPPATRDDRSPPRCAASRSGLCVVYIPRGNAGRVSRLHALPRRTYEAWWYDPRTGRRIELTDYAVAAPEWTLPPRPAGDEDWVLVLAPRR